MTRKGRKRKLDSEETSLTEWETRNLMSDKVREEMKTIWEIPQIFHFLHLTKKVLSIGNLSMYEMERMLLIPRASKQLAHIMTCLLSPPGLKTKLRRIPPMPYEYWTNILFHKIKSWFKIYHGKREDSVKVLESIGVEPGFWQIFPDVSSLEGQDFEELTFRQRVWLLKTICDTMMHTRKTVQEEMSKQMTEEQSEMLLGIDRYGARYVYLPQILENDIRVYRHCLDNKILSTVKAPVIKLETETQVKVEMKKGRGTSKPGKARRRKSRWRNGALPSRMRKRIKRQEDALLQKSNASPLSIENIPSRAASTCSDDVESGCSKQSDISCISKSSNSSEDTIISTETECLRSKSSGYGTNTPNDFKSNDEISLSEVFHGFPKNVNDNSQRLLEKAAIILDTNSDAGSSVDFQNDSSKRSSNEKTKNDDLTQNVHSTEIVDGKSEKQTNIDTAASIDPQTQILSTTESETMLNIVDEAESHLGIKLSPIPDPEVMPNSGVHSASESELDPLPNPDPEIALNTESEVNSTLEHAISSNSETDVRSNSDSATMSNYDSATTLNCDAVPTSNLESTKTPKPDLEVTFDPESNVTINVDSQESLNPTSDMITTSNSNAMLHLHQQDNGKSDVKLNTASNSEEELKITSEKNKLNFINVKTQDLNENDTQLTKSILMSDSKDNATKVMVKPVDADISLEELSCSSKTDDEKLNERMSNDDAYKIQGVNREGSNMKEILFVSKSDDEKLIETKLKDSTSYDEASLEQRITDSTSRRSSMKPISVPDSENILSVLKEADGKWLRNRLVRNDPEETSKSDRSSSTFGEDSLTDVEMNRASPDLPVWERYNLRKPKMMKKEEVPQEEIVNFDELLKDLSISKFELIADSVEGLRDVVAGMTSDNYDVKTEIPLSKRSRPQCETKLINKMLDLIASLEKRESAFNDATKKARAKLHKEWNNFKEGVVEDQDWSSDGSLGLGFNWWVIGSQGCHLLPPASDATISTLSQATVPQPDANHRQTRSSDRTNNEQLCDEQTQKNHSEKQQQQSSSSGCDDRDAQNECEQSDNREQDESLAQYKESGGESDAGSRRVLRTRGVSSYTEQVFTSDEDVDENELERWASTTPKHTTASSSPTTPVTPGPSTSEQVEVWQSEDSDQDWILPSSRKRKNRRSVGRKLKSLQQKLQYISGESEEQTSPTKLITPLKSTSMDVYSVPQDSLTSGSITNIPNASNLNSISSDSIKSNWDSENLGNDLNNSKADSKTSITKIDSLECSQAVPSSPICKIANVESIHSEIDIKDEITSNDQTTSINNYHLNMQSGGYVVVKTEQGPMSNYYIMSQAPPIPTTIIPPNAAMPNMMPQRYYIQSPQNYNVMSQQPNFINHQHHERPQLITHPHAIHPNYVQMQGPSQSYVMQPQMQQIQHQIQPMHPQMQPMNPQMYQPIQQHHLTPRGYYISQSPRGNIVMPPQNLRMMHHGRPTVIRNGMSFPHGAVIRSSLPIRAVGPRTNVVPRRNSSTQQQQHSDARTKKYGKKVQTKNSANVTTTSLIVLSDSDDEIEMIVAKDKSEKSVSSKPTPNEAQSREKPTVTSHVAVSASNNTLPPQIIQRMSQGGISITPVKAPQQQQTLQNPNTQLVVVVNETGSHYALSLPNGSKLILTNEQVAQIRASNGGMENSGESGDDGGPLSTSGFLGGGGVTASYIGVQSDDLEDDPENTDDSNHGGGDPLQGAVGGGPLREQDRFLPIANVAKIMKRAIPEAGKIAKDARECVQECVSEFISFITSEASDRCHMEKRKTINGEDILFAMTTLGFDNYVEPLKVYLQKYREATKGDNPGGGGIGVITANGKTDPQGNIYEDQLFTIATTTNATTSDAPVIYSYSSTDQMQFPLS